MLGALPGGEHLITPTTSYANAGGTGDRTGLIIVTANFTPNTGNVDRSVDGSLTGNSSGGFLVGNGTAATGLTVTWDFTGYSERKYIDEVTCKCVSAAGQGVSGKFQGSINGVSFYDVSSIFAWDSNAKVVSCPSMDPDGVNYLRFIGTSGSFTSNYWLENEFKIASGAL